MKNKTFIWRFVLLVAVLIGVELITPSGYAKCFGLIFGQTPRYMLMMAAWAVVVPGTVMCLGLWTAAALRRKVSK